MGREIPEDSGLTKADTLQKLPRNSLRNRPLNQLPNFKIPDTSVMYNSFYLWGSHFYSTQTYSIQHPGVRPHESPPDVSVLRSELFWRHEPIASRSFHCCAWHVDQRSYRIYVTSLLLFLIDNLFRVELTCNWSCISFYFTFCFYFSNKNELDERSLFNRRLVVWIQQTTV